MNCIKACNYLLSIIYRQTFVCTDFLAVVVLHWLTCFTQIMIGPITLHIYSSLLLFLCWESTYLENEVLKSPPNMFSEVCSFSVTFMWTHMKWGCFSPTCLGNKKNRDVPTVVLSSYQFFYFVWRFRWTFQNQGHLWMIFKYQGQRDTSSKAWPLNTATGTFLLSK